MYIHEFNDQQLSRFLTINESRYTKKDFFAFLCRCQDNDKRNFWLRCMSIAGISYALVIGEHFNKRVKERAWLSVQQQRDLIVNLLEDDLIGSVVTSNPVMYEDETKKVIPYCTDSGIMATAVVDEVSGYIVLFEAGFTYVRGITIWTIGRPFGLRKDTTAVKRCKDYSIINNPADIPEVYYQRDKTRR